MCGIAGFLKAGLLAPDEARADLRRMAAALAHRGPDDEGVWLDAVAGIGLCHRRLSILDLSPLGHQPMTSASGRYTLSFNGEIYNHEALRAELLGRGHAFSGGSDTEVLLAACEEWGLLETLRRSRGMFAIALWDSADRTLRLARDRFGEKPLYHAQLPQHVVFGSELKALQQHPSWRADIDRAALAAYMRYGFIPAPHTIFRDVRKVRPGCIVCVRAERRIGGGLSIEEQEYWRPSAVPAGGREPGDERCGSMVERVHEALREAIRLQRVADVPVGAFLSGGIDSSLVVALMQQASGRAVRTFSIGFAEPEFDEGPFARRVAQHLGTDHTELTVTPRDALEIIPHVARFYDEPFADSSQIPTLLLCGLARRHVTVSLSGDAGDELFGGYGRYQEARARWRRIERVPLALRLGAARLAGAVPLRALDLAARPAGALLGFDRGDVADRLMQRARQWDARSLPEYYHAFFSYWHPSSVVAGEVGEADCVANRPGEWVRGADGIAHMMYVDSRVYLPDDILVKVDRAAMSVALETRIPFLDPNVAEAAWRIPLEVHLRDGRGKWVLRQLLERYVPRALIDRPKMGFGVPIGRWLRSELREWAEDLLAPSRLRSEGFFDSALIERRWRQHVGGRANWAPHLWTVLMFQSWLEEARRPAAMPASVSRGYDPVSALS